MKKVLFISSLLASIFMSICHASTVLQDNFNNGEISSVLWTTDASEHLNLSESNGALVAQVDDELSGLYLVKSQFILSGDFDAQIEYNWLFQREYPSVDNTFHQMFVFRNVNDIWSQSWLTGHTWGTGNREHTYFISLDDETAYNSGWRNNFPDTGKMRIRRVGSTWTGYWDYGSGWVSLGSFGFIEDDVTVIIRGDNGLSPQNQTTFGGFEMAWDNFYVEADAITYIPEPGTLSLLALSGLALVRRRRP